MDRINAQLNITEKAKRSDLVIDNTLDVENTKQQVITAWQNVREKMNNAMA
jgi:dephospho-CoA kinase